MFDRSLEGMEGKVKLIENIFAYLDNSQIHYSSLYD